jgi:hypothetical protein
MTILLGCSLILCSCRTSSDQDWMSLEEYLYDAGARAECYFTLEKPRSDSHVWARIDFQNLPRPLGIERLVEILGGKLKGVKVVRSTENPVVIHLIDERLVGKHGYAMDKTASIRFSGAACFLPDELGKVVGGAIKRVSGGSTLYPFADDCSTQLNFHAHNEQVRDILTGHLPLSRYSRILWIGWTSLTTNGLETEVHYTGPR